LNRLNWSCLKYGKEIPFEDNYDWLQEAIEESLDQCINLAAQLLTLKERKDNMNANLEMKGPIEMNYDDMKPVFQEVTLPEKLHTAICSMSNAVYRFRILVDRIQGTESVDNPVEHFIDTSIGALLTDGTTYLSKLEEDLLEQVHRLEAVLYG